MRGGLLVPLLVIAGVLLLPTVFAQVGTNLLAETAPHSAAYKWTASARRPALKRTEVAGGVVNGDIYVVGGFVEPNRSVAAVERLHDGRWTRATPLPVPLNHAGAVGYRGALYVVGGYASKDGLGQPVKTLYRYDPKRKRWSRLPDMPTPRAALAVGAADGKIFAAGGANDDGARVSFEIYDIAKRRWRVGPPLSVPREHMGGAAGGGRFFAVAGRNASGNLAIVERYDIARNRWTRLPDAPTKRGGSGAALVRAGLFAVGGEESAGTIEEVDFYDFAKRKWFAVDPMPTPRHGLAVVVRAGRVYVIEGGPQPGFAFSNAVEVLSPDRPPR